MNLTIIPHDGTVCENGTCYMNLSWVGTPVDVHALQWQDVAGWIEYNDGKPNEDITTLPAWVANAEAAWAEANKPPAPSGPPTAEQNQQTALSFLSATDFTEIPSVSDPSNVPYLKNKDAFVTYRNEVRIFAVYPVPGEITWPVKPVEQWSDPFEGIS